MSKVVVTGAAGFIGSHLVRRLAEVGCEVTALVRRREQSDYVCRCGVHTHLADVTQKSSLLQPLRGADVVFHLAGSVRAVSLDKFRAVNVEGVRNVVEACAALPNPPTVVLVSSLAAAGPSKPGEPRKESDVPAPISHYGTSKLEGEQVAHLWAKEIPISIVRPPFVFGGGDRASFPIFRMVHRWGAQILLRGHDLELSLIHVDDFVWALHLVAERGLRIEEASNPCVPTPTPFNSVGLYSPTDAAILRYSQMGHLIGKSMGRPVRTWRVRRPWIAAACAINAALARITGRPAILNSDKLREATAPAWTCSNERSERELGFCPAAPLAERIRETAAWYEQEGWL